jgi:hypothetical protein
MEVGRSWKYKDIKEHLEFVLKVEEHLNYKGRQVAKVRRQDRNEEYDLLTTSGALELMLRHDDTNGALDWSDDPVPFSKAATVAIGDKYEAVPKSYTNPVTGGNFRWIIVIKKLQNLKVPFGDLKDVLRIDIKNVDTASGAEISKFKMYLGQGIGTVKREGRFISTSFKQELISVN